MKYLIIALLSLASHAQDPFAIPKEKPKKVSLFDYKKKNEFKGYILKCYQNGKIIDDYYGKKFKDFSEGLGSYALTDFEDKVVKVPKELCFVEEN